jgi:hypothetical protein
MRKTAIETAVETNDYTMPRNDDGAECVVCWNETERRCSPCGDPVCVNCGCPSGCEKLVDEPVRWPLPAYAPFAA